MKKRLFSLLRQQRGNTAIEFGLISVILFMMVFGIIEFGLIMYASSVIENATVGGSRVGITGRIDGKAGVSSAQRDAAIRAEVRKLSGGLLDETKLVIKHKVYQTYQDISKAGQVSGGPANGCGGQAVIYTVSYNWKLFTPLIGAFFDQGAYNISASSLVKNEDFGKEVTNCP